MEEDKRDNVSYVEEMGGKKEKILSLNLLIEGANPIHKAGSLTAQ